MPVKTTNLNRPMGAAALRTVERQRQMANALQAQSMQPLRGQMAGRVYVPPSPFQGAAKLAQMLAGTYGQRKADEMETQIDTNERQQFLKGATDWNTARAPIPAVAGSPEILASETQYNTPPQTNRYSIYTNEHPVTLGEGHKPAVDYQPEVKGSPAQHKTQLELQQADLNLMGSTNSRLRDLGASAYTMDSKVPEVIKIKEDEEAYQGFDKDGNLKRITPERTGKSAPLSQFGKTLKDRDRYDKGSPEYELITAKLAKDVTLTKAYESTFQAKLGTAAATVIEDYVYNGKSAMMAGNLKKLDMSIQNLIDDPKLTGTFKGNLWDPLLASLYPKSFAAKQRILQVVQGTLRPTLGAVFTDAEGQRIEMRAVDWRLGVPTILKRIKMLARETRLMHESKQAVVNYAIEHGGDMSKFRGEIRSINDFSDEALGLFELVDSKGNVVKRGRPSGASISPEVLERMEKGGYE
jgi:hypothetical protein|tara:strand:- start:483 stop:1883 length:1401 start_codon:yes stop_codon:yes gene_type:complete